MIRIVGVQRSSDVAEEFVLLQNQGSMRVNLRGHALISESSLRNADCASAIFVTDDVDLMPGQYALIRTCSGNARWSHTPEGYHIFYSYAGKTESLWSCSRDTIHILSTQHSYCERLIEPLLV